MTTQQIARGRRITGTAREVLAKKLVARYEKGESIRALAESIGRSYGFVHRLLSDAPGVKLRDRGGATRIKRQR